MITQDSLKYDAEVQDNGRVEITVPFPAGSHVIVYVVTEYEDRSVDDLAHAAQSSTDFWDNPLDDEDWNDA